MSGRTVAGGAAAVVAAVAVLASCGASAAPSNLQVPTDREPLPQLHWYDMGDAFPIIGTGCVAPGQRIVITDRWSVSDGGSNIPVVVADPGCKS